MQKMTNEELLKIIEETAKNRVTQLDLKESGLTSLPPEIGSLTHLKRLYLNCNKLESLPPEIGKLTNLNRLYLRDNKLTSLPPEIGNLTNLTHIYLRSNKLTSLPPEIANFTKLKGLFASDNQLKTLPEEMENLTEISTLDLRRNPLPIPPEIIDNIAEPSLIIQYLHKYKPEEAKALDRAKIQLLGVKGGGKTSLLQRLISDKFDRQETPTASIDIQPWEIQVDDRQIEASVWDFGAQECMYFAYQFFITQRSLYLLVVDATKGQKENQIEYWLELIQSFGGNSPVVIVINKVDEQHIKLNRSKLYSKYKNIKAFIETSCLQNQGIEELKNIIYREIITLEHLQEQFQPTWFTVKEKLEQIEKVFIPYSEYERMCRSEAIIEESDQRNLIALLNDLGSVVYPKDDRLKDGNIYNPKLVIEGIYKVLNESEFSDRYRGIIKLNQLNPILNNLKYSIADAMCNFELAFEVEEEQKLVIMDLLAEEQPKIGEWEDFLAFEYHYNLLPSSIISRFIVRNQKYIENNKYWRYGAVLDKDGDRALVKADLQNNKISIWVSGATEKARDKF